MERKINCKGNAILNNTLRYGNKLIAMGFTKQQAEVQAESIPELINDNLATKRDLVEAKNELTYEIRQA